MNDLFPLGDTLRMAREQLKMSQRDVADATRIKAHIIDAIEHNDFSRISVPLYGKGFIKLYAECVGLDPEPLVKDYMTRYASSVRPSLRSEHPVPNPAPHEPLPAMPSAQLARKRPRVDWRAALDDAAHALRERIARWTVAWVRLQSATRSAVGSTRGRRYRQSTFSLQSKGRVRYAAMAVGILVAAGLLVYGGVRLAHRPRRPTVVTVPVRTVPLPPSALAAVRGAVPLQLAIEPPALYLKPRLP